MKSDFKHVWTIPGWLGSVSLIGLVAALIGDGTLDIVSWVALAIPLFVIGWFVIKPHQRRRL